MAAMMMMMDKLLFVSQATRTKDFSDLYLKC